MSLSDRIAADLTAAIKAKAEPDRTVLRGLSAAIKNAQIEAGTELDDASVLKVVEKQAKQRQETIAAAKETRPDLAATEEAEAAVLATYLPEPLSEAELTALVEAAISETGAASAADMGMVMGALQPQIAGRADGKAVAGLVRSRLS